MAEPKFLSKKMLAGGAMSVSAFTSIVFAYIDSKTSALDQKINDKYEATKTYVDLRHSEVQGKLENIEKILFRIDDRVYAIKRKVQE